MEAGGFGLASDKFISHLKVITALLVSLNGKSIKRQTQINPERSKPRLSRPGKPVSTDAFRSC